MCTNRQLVLQNRFRPPKQSQHVFFAPSTSASKCHFRTRQKMHDVPRRQTCALYFFHVKRCIKVPDLLRSVWRGWLRSHPPAEVCQTSVRDTLSTHSAYSGWSQTLIRTCPHRVQSMCRAQTKRDGTQMDKGDGQNNIGQAALDHEEASVRLCI